MIIYIAGPITGIFNYKEEFFKREITLRNMGHIVINPSYLPAGLCNYMPICKAMIDQADAVYFMSGWENSIGANEEHKYAKEKNKQIIYEEGESNGKINNK